MDCKTARLLLDFHRPRAGELPADEAAELERHLAGCADCDAVGRAARRLDDHLGPAIRNVPLPDGLRERLLTRLKDDRSTRLRRRFAWAARGVAVAAVLLIGTLLWLYFRPPEPLKLDLPRLSQGESEIDHLKSPESVALWFKEKHHVAMVPPPFDYTSLVDCDLADVQGRRVPRLLFYRDLGPEKGNPTRATVYVFSRDQFNLDALEALNDTPVDDFSQPVQVRRQHVEGQDSAYLILYRGDLKIILRSQPGA